MIFVFTFTICNIESCLNVYILYLYEFSHRKHLSESDSQRLTYVNIILWKSFLASDGASHPGVIDMFGTAGGLVEFRAALLASRGFTTLALAYFGYDDLPKGLQIDSEYFEVTDFN